MPRLTPVHWKKLKCVFEKAGFKENRTLDSHISFTKKGISRPILIPKYNSVGVDIVKSNMKTAGMSRDEYFNLLKQC